MCSDSKDGCCCKMANLILRRCYNKGAMEGQVKDAAAEVPTQDVSITPTRKRAAKTTASSKPSAPPKVAPANAELKKFLDPINICMGTYESEGWKVIRAPKGSINDFLAQRQSPRKLLMHFVQVVTPKTAKDLRFDGIQLNTFVQNALSNGAVPIHARLSSKKDAAGNEHYKAEFVDVNSLITVKIARPKQKVADPTSTV